jgi:hypothetical protein
MKHLGLERMYVNQLKVESEHQVTAITQEEPPYVQIYFKDQLRDEAYTDDSLMTDVLYQFAESMFPLIGSNRQGPVEEYCRTHPNEEHTFTYKKVRRDNEKGFGPLSYDQMMSPEYWDTQLLNPKHSNVAFPAQCAMHQSKEHKCNNVIKKFSESHNGFPLIGVQNTVSVNQTGFWRICEECNDLNEVLRKRVDKRMSEAGYPDGPDSERSLLVYSDVLREERAKLFKHKKNLLKHNHGLTKEQFDEAMIEAADYPERAGEICDRLWGIASRSKKYEKNFIGFDLQYTKMERRNKKPKKVVSKKKRVKRNKKKGRK